MLGGLMKTTFHLTMDMIFHLCYFIEYEFHHVHFLYSTWGPLRICLLLFKFTVKRHRTSEGGSASFLFTVSDGRTSILIISASLYLEFILIPLNTTCVLACSNTLVCVLN
jgi:hypothetical protein